MPWLGLGRRSLPPTPPSPPRACPTFRRNAMSLRAPLRSFKPRLVALATAAALTLGAMQPAHALFGVGDIVLDPVNLVQNTMTAARTLEQINNQIRQLQNEAQMLINQARNLASLPFNVVNRLRSTLDTTRQLIAQAQGLAYQVSHLNTEFARLYPEQYAATVSGNQMFQDAHQRWKNTLNGLQTAMQMKAQEAKQSIQSQQLMLTQDRAASLELARQAAAIERGREVTRRFIGSGTGYTPQGVSFYGH